jgi:nucleoside-triphosphatase THEP1
MLPRIAIITGERASGKTTACRRAAEILRARGLSVGGIVCPSERGPEGLGRRIWAEDLRSGSRRLLASRGEELGGPVWPPPGRIAGPAADSSPAPGSGPPRDAFGFSASCFGWALALLEGELEREEGLVVVDEVGPVEIELGAGFRPFLDRLSSSMEAGPRGSGAIVTVRPSLAGETRRILGPSRLFRIDRENRDETAKRVAEYFVGL